MEGKSIMEAGKKNRASLEHCSTELAASWCHGRPGR